MTQCKMTIRDKLLEELVSHGLWEDETNAILDTLENDTPSMTGRWHEDVNNYPPQMFAVLLISAKAAAVKYIDANCPNHFARIILTQSL